MVTSILLILGACSTNGAGSAGAATVGTMAYTIVNKPLSSAEQQVADGENSEIMANFVFENGGQYDIHMYLYQDGATVTDMGLFRVDTGDEDETVRLFGEKKGNIGVQWHIEQGNTGATMETMEEIDDEGAFVTVSGIGREKIVAEAGEEYLLAYVARATQSHNAPETDTFAVWDTVDDKAAALADYSYAHIVTVKLRDS